MRNILQKEFRLSASPLSYFFILFGAMFFLPGYPILCGFFFVTLGIFQSFLNAREANDLVFSALLPIAKRDVVKGKYLFACFIELCAALLMAAAVALRMTVFSEAIAYRQNALMNANLFALGAALTGFGLFNAIFVGGFFRTAYYFTKPFIFYAVAAFLFIGLAEAAHYVPGLAFLNAFGTEELGAQLVCLLIGAMLFALLTFLSYRRSCRRFEKIDL